MNTKDGRFIENRIKIEIKQLEKILIAIKKEHKLTWKALAEQLGVSEQTVRHGWIKKGNTIPDSLFRKIIKLSAKIILYIVFTLIFKIY